MKKYRALLSVLLVGVLCVCGASPCAALSQDRVLLDTALLLDGAEHVVVNEDGSWTVTGDFTLSFPLLYDYRMEEYLLCVQAASNGTYDLEVDFIASENTMCPVLLGKDVFGTEFTSGIDDTSFSMNFRSLYQYNQLTGLWDPTNYQVQCTTMTYRAGTATSTVFKRLEYRSVAYSLFGDVNNDGEVDTGDVRALLSAILGAESRDLQNIDIDGNLVLNTADARELLNTVVV